MLSRWMRTWSSQWLLPLLRALARLGVTPNLLTLISLLVVVFAASMLAQGLLVSGGIVYLLGASLDGLDGLFARAVARESRFGAFLDSICDHLGDFAIYLGLVWYYLSQYPQTEIILIMLALFGSLFGSQVRSRAGMLGIETRDVGVFTRFERTLILAMGLFGSQLLLALLVLAVFNNLSAVQRLWYIVRHARHINRES